MPGDAGLFPAEAARAVREVVAASPLLREHLGRIDATIGAIEGMLGGYVDLGRAQQVWRVVAGRLRDARAEVGSAASGAEPGWRGDDHQAYLDYRAGVLHRMEQAEQTVGRLAAVVGQTRSRLAEQYRVSAAALVRAAGVLVVLSAGTGRVEGAAVRPALTVLCDLVDQVALALPPVDAAFAAGRASLAAISGAVATSVPAGAEAPIPPRPPERGPGADPAVA